MCARPALLDFVALSDKTKPTSYIHLDSNINSFINVVVSFASFQMSVNKYSVQIWPLSVEKFVMYIF